MNCIVLKYDNSQISLNNLKIKIKLAWLPNLIFRIDIMFYNYSKEKDMITKKINIKNNYVFMSFHVSPQSRVCVIYLLHFIPVFG